ncbi:MAG: hypothetical protein LC772_04185 [Chloroflexi bacterium]|nr:hypothetical protein [Chloroflexota bacterium]
MALDEKINEALRIENLSLPSELPIEKISVEEYIDSTGDEALKVSVLLRDDFDEDTISGEAVNRLNHSIRDSLVARGILLFPYIWLKKQSDLKAGSKSRRRYARPAA